jgi:glutathione S-transferase
VDEKHGGDLKQIPAPAGPPADAVLYVKSRCGFSRATLLACHNLHLQERLTLRNVTEDDAARSDLVALVGKDQAPCLVADGKPLHESAEIIRYLVRTSTDIAG